MILGRAAKRQDTHVHSDAPSKAGMARVFGERYTGSHAHKGVPCMVRECKHYTHHVPNQPLCENVITRY